MAKKLIKRIGIFDSGMGGLTILKKLHKYLPGVNFYYLGDTARLPYGTKSPETIIQYTKQNVAYLTSKKIDLLIIACNTASAYTIPLLKETLDIPVFGVIEPGARAAILKTKNNKIGIIGTRATISSKAYQNELKKLNKKVKLFTNPASLLVPLVEEGWISGNITEEIIKIYIDPLLEEGIDTLILGCTHYPMLTDAIKKIAGNLSLVDSASSIKTTLLENFDFDHSGKGRLEIFITDYPDSFSVMSKRFMKSGFDKVEHIDINAPIKGK